MWFTPKLSWWKTRQHLANQGKKAMFSLLRFVRKQKISYTQALFLFDRMVAPILYYGCEIWGYEPVECIENVQVSFCKKLLCISSSVSNVAVLGDLGRFALSTCYMKRCIMYWVKLVSMLDYRYPKKCYNMLLELDKVGRKTWVTNIKVLLNFYGFSAAWEAQSVGDIRIFTAVLNQRLKEKAHEAWYAAVLENNKLNMYSQCKSLLIQESYITSVCNVQLVRSLLLFRCSGHQLAIETGRWSNTPVAERICHYCNLTKISVIEDEKHFLYVCPLYIDLREKYLSEFTLVGDVHKDVSSMCDSVYAWRLALYIYQGMKKRLSAMV